MKPLNLLFCFVCRATSADEMCNFYIMYYMDSRHAVPYMTCMEPGSKELFQHIPDEANMPIAVSPADINSMMHMRHSTGTRIYQYCLYCIMLTHILLLFLLSFPSQAEYNLKKLKVFAFPHFHSKQT